ncbi:hypothetical protein MBAV_002656 [Candidatus Magnetobacterium bavaricum]|uniref:Glycosyltransferase n=1 Tax=Candidatus Magnetobacterium bavaricum TaxID=29290 RepID=A0A0F3GWU3_9BACT|nr:hypothetical protein MBAV_002656 [Candidatus Magnetobacterium bavaricum]
MKELMLVLQTMDMNHPRARRCIEHLKKTDLSMAELFIVDMVYGDGFNRGSYLEGFRKLAEGRPLVLLWDDVLIEDIHWLTQLRDIAGKSDVLVVGCQYRIEGSGVKVAGAIVDHTGVMGQIADLPAAETGSIAYVPLIPEGVVFVSEPEKISFDGEYQGSLCEADVCMQAWKIGKRVAVSLDPAIKRMMPPVTDNNPADREHFDRKWRDFINDSLYTVQELKWLERHLKK